MACDRKHYQSRTAELIDFSQFGPHLFTSANFQIALCISHLPKLLHQKYGKCMEG